MQYILIHLNPAYVDDEDVCQIGSLNISAPDIYVSGMPKFDVAFYFGKTETTLTVKEVGNPGAVEKTTRIDFSAS